MILTTYNGADLWLVVAEPNRTTNPKLTTTLPFTDVQRAVSARESRRAFGLTRKHTYVYTPTFRSAFLANQFRLGLNTLKTELVGVPLWDDLCLTTAALTSTGVTVAIDQPPARFGRSWLFLAPDGFDFEIVTVNSVDTSLHMAARTGSAWPKGSKVYPLLFGRLADRPQFDATTPSRMTGELSFIENSPLAEAITAYDNGVALPTVGGHIAAFSTYLRWTLEPNWSRLLDNTEADILYKTVGFGREDAFYAFPNWNRRGLELEVECRNRTDIAWVERVFADRVGPLKPFFIPTFRADLELAADAASGATSFQIKDSAYELPEYDQVPGSAFLAFVDGSGVYPQRVNLVSGNTVTVAVALSQDHKAATTRTSFFMLVRFAEAKIEWDYITPSRATARIKFVEVADEYVTPNTAIFQQAFVYHFEETLPNGTTNEWFFTSYEASITSFGNTYLPSQLTHGAFERNLSLTNSLELISFGGAFPNNPLNRFLPYTLNAELKVTLAKVSTDGATARILWSGVVKKLSTVGKDWTAECGLSDRFNRKVPGFLFQSGDNFSIFDPASGVNAATYKVTGTIASISGMTITVSGSNKPLDWFSGGYLDTGVTGHAEARTILKSTVSGTTQTLTIDRPFFYAVVGQSIDLYPGYDGTIDQRETKFADRPGFGGHPYIPPSNPAAKGPDVAAPSGGKKG